MSFIMGNQRKPDPHHTANNDKSHPTLMIFDRENNDQSSRSND